MTFVRAFSSLNLGTAGAKITGILHRTDSKKYGIIFIVLFIVLIAFSIRAYDIFGAGLTWDEDKNISSAIHFFIGISSIVHLDLGPWTSIYFAPINEHPPVGKYIYSVALFLFNGLNHDFHGLLVCRYTSALMGALTCGLTCLIGREIYDEITGILAALILTFIPFVVGHNQLVGLDTPLALFFTLTLLLLLLALRSGNRLLFACAAVSTGLTVGTKLNGVIVLPVIGVLLACWLYDKKEKIRWSNLLLWSSCYLLLSVNVFIWIWPWLWSNSITLRTNPLSPLLSSLGHWSYVPQEYFLGTLGHAPVYYYPVYFAVTTPLLLLFLCFAGIVFSLRSKEPIKLIALAWFALPFLYGLSNMVQDGMRYLLFIYPALALICAYGIVSLSEQKILQRYVRRNTFILCSGAAIALYLIILLAYVHPYYIDYYNVLSGGQQQIYDNKLFELGSWGEGISDSISYVDRNGAPGSTVLVKTLPPDPDSTYRLIASNLTYLTLERENLAVFFARNGTMALLNKSSRSGFLEGPDYIVQNVAYEQLRGADVDEGKYELEYQTKMGNITLCKVYRKRVNDGA